MIPMTCPACGRRGNVPPNKMNARLHCKKCDAVFHMDMTGQAVLGEPGSEAAKAHRPARAREPITFRMGPSSLTRVPWPLKLGVGVVVLAALAWFLIPRIAPSLPEELVPRAEYIGQAFVNGDADSMHKVVDPATRDALVRWFETSRPAFDHDGSTTAGAVLVSGMVIEESATTALVVVSLMPPTQDRKGRAHGPLHRLHRNRHVSPVPVLGPEERPVAARRRPDPRNGRGPDRRHRRGDDELLRFRKESAVSNCPIRLSERSYS